MLVQSQDPQKESARCFLLHLVHSAAGNLEPRPFTQEACGCGKEKGGETGSLGLSSLRAGVPTPYVLREGPLSCCSPDRRGPWDSRKESGGKGGAAALLKFLFGCVGARLQLAGSLSCGQRAGSLLRSTWDLASPTRDQACTAALGEDPQPLDPQGIPLLRSACSFFACSFSSALGSQDGVLDVECALK